MTHAHRGQRHGIATRLPTTPAKLWGTLVGLGIVWAAAYWVNSWVWDLFFDNVLRMDPSSRLTGALHFFCYDVIKIGLLLSGIVFLVTILRSYMSIERTRALLGGRREGVGNVAAASLGVVTPFCSCSAVPAFIGFVAAGVPLGVTLSFLIASPLVNEVAIGLLLSLFGVKITALYVGSGLFIAITAGWLLGRMRLERWVEPFVFETRLDGQVIDATSGLTFEQRVRMGIEEVGSILRRIGPYLLVGIGIGAAIHGWAPEDLFTRYAGPGAVIGVPLAVLVGIPLYSNAAGILPLVESLHDKGMPMGTLLAFMMAVVALSLPEMILLRQVLKIQLLAIYVAVVGLSIIAVGYLFNAVLA
ncbi:permease [Methylocystis sp.]|uniref:permease n=1 Tax=Methylocystis sp. TaxID=1911079 RepID=UPI003DA27944